ALFFRYHLTGTDQVRIGLTTPKNNRALAVETKLKTNAWDQHVLVWDTAGAGSATEIEFRLGKGATLLIDDVLLYEPADEKKSSRIIALGDSITKGVRPGVKAEETFASLLQESLRKEGRDVEVVNAGVGGATTQGGLAQLDKLLQ